LGDLIDVKAILWIDVPRGGLFRGKEPGANLRQRDARQARWRAAVPAISPVTRGGHRHHSGGGARRFTDRWL